MYEIGGSGTSNGFTLTPGDREISLSTMSDDSQYWVKSDVVTTKMISVSRRVQIHRDTLTKLKFEKMFFLPLTY